MMCEVTTMNDDLEKILAAQPGDFERVMFRAEEWIFLLERTFARNAEVAAILDKSYDALLRGLIANGDDPDETEISDKTRNMVRGYREMRDANADKLLNHLCDELHTLHALHRRQTT
jgi:hypothetical protein